MCRFNGNILLKSFILAFCLSALIGIGLVQCQGDKNIYEDENGMLYEPVDLSEEGKIVEDDNGVSVVVDRINLIAKEDVEEESIDALLEELNARKVGIYPQINGYTVEVEATNYQELEQFIQILGSKEEIELAEASPIISFTATDVEDRATEGETDKVWGFQKIQAIEAWNLLQSHKLYSRNSESVKIAVIDSGVDTDHEDLESNLTDERFDLTALGTDCNELNEDEIGHGTYVAGIIASMVNGEGINGVAYNAEILPIKIKCEADTSVDAMTAAIMIATDQNVEVINMSLAGRVTNQAQSYVFLQHAIDFAVLRGITIVAAAGNDGEDANGYIPTRYANVIGVGATQSNETENARAIWDGRESNFSEITTVLSVWAPGKSIYSTKLLTIREFLENPLDRYGEYQSGTSAAAPFVSGLAALLIAVNRELGRDPLSPFEIEQILRNTADDVPIEEPDGTRYTGKRINALKVIDFLLDGGELCFDDDGDGYEVCDPKGIPISTWEKRQTKPDVAWNGSIFFVVWEDWRMDGDIYGARISADGTVLDETSIPISTAINTQMQPRVAWNGENFFVVWSDLRNFNPSDGGSYYDIYGAWVSPDGTVLDKEGIPVATGIGNQTDPAIAWNGQFFLIVWQESNRYSWPKIYGVRINQRGEIVDQEGFVLCPIRDYAQLQPSVTWNGANFFVVWVESLSYENAIIYGVQVSSEGNVLDSEGVRISTLESYKESPNVSWGETNHLVVWYDRDNNTGLSKVYGARVSSTGSVIDSPEFRLLNIESSQVLPNMIWNGTNFFVVWSDYRSDSGDIYGTRVNSGGFVLDPEGIAISTEKGDQSAPRVISTGQVTFITWSDTRSSLGSCDYSCDIYGARVVVSP